MPTLVLLRHGQSQWNLTNLFTGWSDPGLSEQGRREAARAGGLLSETGLEFAVGFTSLLSRAIKTLWLALEAMDAMWLPQECTWRLNERHYGALQGLNKAETAARYGEEQVRLWRRSYETAPPLLDPEDPSHPRFDRRYWGVDPKLLPAGESLADCLARVTPFCHGRVRPLLSRGENVIIAAHGNSLRAVLKNLMHISDEEIPALEIPTGNPLVLSFDPDLNLSRAEYLDQTRAQPLP